MADAITLLTSGAQSPGTIIQSGQTLLLDGYRGGAVAPEKQVKGGAVDVSVYSTLRIALTVTQIKSQVGFNASGPIIADEHGAGDATLYCVIETAPAANGPWSPLASFPQIRTPGEHRLPTIATHDKFIRSSHWYGRSNPSEGLHANLTFTFGISAEALPEQP